MIGLLWEFWGSCSKTERLWEFTLSIWFLVLELSIVSPSSNLFEQLIQSRNHPNLMGFFHMLAFQFMGLYFNG